MGRNADSPEDTRAAQAISSISSTGGVRIVFTQMSGLTPRSTAEWAGGNARCSGRGAHTPARSHTPASAHTSCHNSLAGVKTTYTHLVDKPPPALSRAHMARCGIKKVARRAGPRVLSLLTGRRGAGSLRCPPFSPGEGAAPGGSPCTEILRRSGCSLPGPAEEDKGGFDEERLGVEGWRRRRGVTTKHC